MNNNGKPDFLSGKKKPVMPIPVHRLVLTVFDNGKLSVAGIPPSLRVAIGMLYDANLTISTHFVEKAKAGELDENNNLVMSDIIKPGMRPIII